MRTTWIGMGLVVGALLVWGCGGGAALGEACEDEGADGECEDGAVCGKPDDSAALECLKVCVEQADCPADQECNGISGSDIKGCRPK
ncbi:hypothetical protein WME98_42855 [Sorangium sp. So ce296]|uniref:hypothetical protein n=1 Tax=Sorangium sp. So ce296 TaxID=3133296 RepID=UPI003F60256E